MKKSLNILEFFIVAVLLVNCSSPDKKDRIESKSIAINLEDANPERFDSIFFIEEMISIPGSEEIPIKEIKRILSLEKNY